MANSVSVFSSDRKYARAASALGKVAQKAARLLNKKSIGLEAYLLTNREMRALNRRFRGKDKVTNVLSFESEAGSMRPDLKKNTRYLGEIFLAPDHIEAKGENLEFLFLHGFLHLLGYTHARKNDRIIMEKLEEKLSDKLIS